MSQNTTGIDKRVIVGFVGTAAALALVSHLILSRNKKKSSISTTSDSVVKHNNILKPPSCAAPSADAQKTTIMQGRIIEGASLDEIRLYDLESLRDKFKSADIPNHSRKGAAKEGGDSIKYNKIIGSEDFIINDLVRKPKGKKSTEAFVRAGPRAITHFDPKYVTAAVVTCGGLCPGLNNVIREIVHSLNHLYGVKKVIGIRGGYNGFTDPAYKPIILTVENTANCHHEGGTILASSRGGFNVDKIIAFLQTHGINQLYVIGGDGTHRGAYIISQECVARGLNVSVVGIPKTIDNDVDLIDRSFGFQTAVEAAQAAILSAHTEAQCNLPNGIGIV
eukprot:gene10019-20858_t